jgi:hypothetical protein
MSAPAGLQTKRRRPRRNARPMRAPGCAGRGRRANCYRAATPFANSFANWSPQGVRLRWESSKRRPCNGGESVSLAHPLATRPSPRAIVSPVFATHPRNRQLTPLFATHPKTGPRKSPVCHTYDTPPGSLSTPFPNSERLQQPNRRPAALLDFGHHHESRFTSHCHSSYCVLHPAVPQLALNDGSTGKQSRFFRCLMKVSGQRVGEGSSPCPAGGRSLRGCSEIRDKSAPNTRRVAGRKGRQCPIGLVP